MHNSFLVIRTVFFALLMYIHVLIILFGAWNIVAATSSGMSALSVSVFLVGSSVLIFVLVPIAYLAELICPKARPAQVRVECTWTVFMSILQLSASICATINGPPMYCQTKSSSLCASSCLLVHLTWLATFTIASYCLMISVTSSVHATDFPNIWRTPVSRVPWFRPDIESSVSDPLPPPRKPSHTSPPPSSWSEASCALSKYITERWDKLAPTERRSIRPSGMLKKPVDPSRPTWAHQKSVRRGVDVPFPKPPAKRKPPPIVIVPPPRDQSRHVLSPSYFRSAEENDVAESPESTLTPRTSVTFASKAGDTDVPVLFPRLSDWIPAELGLVHPALAPTP